MCKIYYIFQQIFFIFLCLFAEAIQADTYIKDNITLSCIPDSDVKKVVCNYKTNGREQILGINARYIGKELPVRELYTYPLKDSVSAILILIDTSDPGRQNVVDKNILDINRILESVKSHHRIGLASFDKSLRLHVPVGTSFDLIREEANKLQAIGKTTELYRSLLTAIDLLKKINADRKTIFLFSDGLAEDRAYFHHDVVSAANKADISITGIGYPRSVSRSVALQTIRRLSEETGGLYIEAGRTRNLPNEFLTNPFASIDNGGVFETNLSGITGDITENNVPVDFVLDSDIDTYRLSVPLDFTGIIKSSESVSKLPSDNSASIPVQKNNDSLKIVTRNIERQPNNYWIWYGIPIFLVVLLIIALIGIVITFIRQSRSVTLSPSRNEDYKPYAYLVLQDETKKRFPITRTTWRIGRSRDNEMTLLDNSISRRHAEIYRDKGEIFTIYDLDSLNGVFVNNEKIEQKVLHEGDIIEIGDIALRFTLLSTDYSSDDSTIMQHTKLPVTH